MLAKRIIPCLDVKNGRVVKGINFINLRDAGDPVELAQRYDEAGADEIVFLDITASHEKRKIMLDVARQTAEEVFIPFTVGGGLRSIEDIREILKAGADKISLNTSAVKNAKLISDSSKKFGSQCIVVAIDGKKIGKDKWIVYINGGRTKTDLDVVKWARQVEKLGAGEILLTSTDRDGTKLGYNIPLTRAVTSAVNIPVIASGGAGKPEHLLEVIEKADADAVLAASIFHYSEYAIKEIKKFLQKNGVIVRL